MCISAFASITLEFVELTMAAKTKKKPAVKGGKKTGCKCK
jgi:hypothetical protein